ncbi:unannotated protein [freshwater metagenome]|uniref:Unannotated protein n=1 Tax=freshwater metagenome TaxID=449393 RepID=A0A6J7HC98_9ZZZZ|nr:hypothetical protein [Actinomycetota bacterium]
MSITAPNDIETEERTREAWERYAEDLRDRTGAAYVEAEAEAWDRLQVELADIAAEQAELVGAGADGA